jgi:parallel beta-helix repeat protein
MKKQRTALVLLLILCFAVSSIPKIVAVEEPAVIGPISNLSAVKIQRDGNVYTFTEDVHGHLHTGGEGFLSIGKSNIIIDGAGHTLQGDDLGYGISITGNNVTIKNLNITNWGGGINFPHPSFYSNVPYNTKILNNTISKVNHGIYAEFANTTIISGNTIKTSDPKKDAIYFGRECYNNSIINNKLIESSLDFYRTWENNLFNNTIDGKLIVQFNSKSNRIIKGAGQVFLFNCTNMTIRNVRPSSDYKYTIHLFQTTNSKIINSQGHIFLKFSHNNTILNNHPKTIELVESKKNKIKANAFTDTDVSIKLDSKSNSNQIYWNAIVNSKTGIRVSHDSEENKIHDNNIVNCSSGISLIFADRNRIYRNNMTECEYPIDIWASSSNTIYHNNFIENRHKIMITDFIYSDVLPIFNAYSRDNKFSSETSSGGNFWSDYNGTDKDGDGIGDTPYDIDKHPLIAPVDITIETELPIITFLSPVTKAYPMNQVPLDFTVDEHTFWTSYSLNGKANVTISENVTLTELTDGTYSLIVYAMDIFGNIGTSSINFTVDTISPSILFLSEENKTYTTTQVPLSIAVNESVSWMAYSLDGQANVTITGNTTLTGLAKGQHNLTLYAEDMAGNIGTSSTAFTVAEPWYSLTTLVVVSGISVTIAVALLLYFKKRKSKGGNVKKAILA